MNKFRVAAALLLASAACGSGSTAITGTVGGKSPKAHHAIFPIINNATFDQTPTILISERDDMCALLQRGQFSRNTDIVEIDLFANYTVDGVAKGPGIYPAVEVPNAASNPNLFAVIAVGTTADATNCLDQAYTTASGGFVTITELGDATRATVGYFDTTFDDGGALSGYFFATPCEVGPNAEDGAATCVP